MPSYLRIPEVVFEGAAEQEKLEKEGMWKRVEL